MGRLCGRSSPTLATSGTKSSAGNAVANELLEPSNPAAGTISRQHWQETDKWVTSDLPTWLALVDPELWERVNARIINTRGPARRRPRGAPGDYLLSGTLRCAACGRSMYGNTLKQKPYYRCNTQRPDYADTGHPRTTAIREDSILSVLDPWLSSIIDPSNRERIIAQVLAVDESNAPEPPHVQTARRSLTQLAIELDRVLAALRAGMDPDLAAATTRQIQRELASAQALVDDWEREHHAIERLSAQDVALALDHAGSLASVLRQAEREPRAQMYRALGLQLQLDVVTRPMSLDARLLLSSGGGGI